MPHIGDFSSWQSIVTSVVGLVAITFLMVGIRLLMMQTLQARRERENRQINERLRTLIAAYKTLGGSFTGELSVDPRHLRDLVKREAMGQPIQTISTDATQDISGSTQRSRLIRDAVEAALSDVILLGTDEQVRLAAKAASELVAGRNIHTADLVVSLRNFIRQVLDLEVIPTSVTIPPQGPARPSVGASSSKPKSTDSGDKDGGGKQAGFAGAAMGGGQGLGFGLGLGGGLGTGMGLDDDETDEQR